MSIKLKDPYILLLLFASFGLVFAYIVEYIMELPVCPLCIYQRFPYLILIVLSIISISGQSKLNKYYIITIVLAIFLASYHTGVERGIFEMSGFCKPLVKISNNMSVSDFTKMLYNAGEIGQCNKPALVIFGLSMTEWNLLFNLFLLTIFIKYRNFRSN
ncbi:MAG: disulfide bond formation protein B [Rickettsiaceae bacterium]|nr:disulfide bond formation protein B [Rickettsiaceae bacterium]